MNLYDKDYNVDNCYKNYNDYKDYMVRAISKDGGVRAFALTSRNLVETAHEIHGTTNVVTAALGRTLTAALMMGTMLKEDRDFLTIRFEGDGPIGLIIVTADSKGHVRGMVQNPLVLLPLKEDGHLNVGAAVGRGTLSVIRDIDREDTYSGSVPIYNGEIAEDLTHYFAESEQVPSSLGLGVLANADDRHVMAAGGFLIQLLPDASEDIIPILEKNISSLPSVTEMLRQGSTPEKMIEDTLRGLAPRILESIPVSYQCECSRERFGKALKLLGRKELDDMIEDKKPIELKCHFCGKKYGFSISELMEFRDSIR